MRNESAMPMAALLVLGIVLGGCAASPPYRELVAMPDDCLESYARVKDGAALGNADLADPRGCFKSSHEKTDAYDLFFVEFDDQGWLADAVGKPAHAPTQMTALMSGLRRLISGGEVAHDEKGISIDQQPLSIIIYVHGWHHSASPNDGDVRSLRRVLTNTSQVEADLCRIKRLEAWKQEKDPKGPFVPEGVCSENETGVLPWQKKRRVVGIFVGWRGDSLFPGWPVFDLVSVWDRKLTAEKVAHGAAQQLFALLHDFYLEHSCHLGERHEKTRKPVLVGRRTGENCADVRMLTVGHSFGSLIVYRALVPRMMVGLVEQFRQNQVPGEIPYAYSYGDLVVLVNPAIEGSRFEALAEAAAARKYQDASGYKTGTEPESRSAQLPILVVATSRGDWVTGTTFPIFRFFTTLFEETRSASQLDANWNTIGWTERYQTHELHCLDAKPCGPNSGGDIEQALKEERGWYVQNKNTGLVTLDQPVLELPNGLRLNKYTPAPRRAPALPNGLAGDPPDDPLPSKPFMPLWVIKTDKNVIKDHNDFPSRNFANFVRQIYYVILAEEDDMMTKLLTNPRAKP